MKKTALLISLAVALLVLPALYLAGHVLVARITNLLSHLFRGLQ